MPEVIVNQKTGKKIEVDEAIYNTWPQSLKDQFPLAETPQVQSSEPLTFRYQDANA